MSDQPMPSVTDRKAEILRLGQHAVARRGERRRTRRHAVAMVLLTASATVLAYAMVPMRIGEETTRVEGVAPPAPRPMIAYVSTSEGLAASLAAPEASSVRRVATSSTAIARVQTKPVDMADRLTDQQALALLQEAGTPAGLIKVGGRATLVYHKQPEPDLGPSGAQPTEGRATLAMLVPYRPM